MFRAHVLIIRRSKSHYTASGIITPIGVMIPPPYAPHVPPDVSWGTEVTDKDTTKISIARSLSSK